MNKKLYNIAMPFTGVLNTWIEADNEKEALSKFHANPPKLDDKNSEIEWDYTEEVCKGNTFNGMQNKMYIEEVEGENDDKDYY
jgi:hypothetical protein